MKISVIIVASGNNIDRYTNALKQLECLQRQTVQPLEIIYVEQRLDGERYFNQLPINFVGQYKYIGLEFKEHPQLFSVSWCRNVGIYNAKGDVVIALDIDYMFDDYYIEKLSDTDITDFIIGWTSIYYIHNKEKVRCLQDKDFPKGEENIPGQNRNRLITDLNKPQYAGGIQIFNRRWFIDNLAGFSEDMFAHGGEDNDINDRYEKLTGNNRKVFNYDIYHLTHGHKQGRKLITQVVMERNRKDPIKTAQLMRDAGVGSKDAPHPIYDDSVKWSLLG